jgi:hypothetical protein
MLRVGHDRIEIDGRMVILDYNNVQYDKTSFASCELYRPLEFDLCLLKTTTGTIAIGWWDGFQYYSGKLRNITYKVTHWKKLAHD